MIRIKKELSLTIVEIDYFTPLNFIRQEVVLMDDGLQQVVETFNSIN